MYHLHSFTFKSFVRYRFFEGKVIDRYIKKWGPWHIRFWPPLYNLYWMGFCIFRGKFKLLPYIVVDGTVQTAGMVKGCFEMMGSALKGAKRVPDKELKDRWLSAQEQEKKGVESADDIKEWLRVRRHTWSSLIDLLKNEIPLDDSKRILDVGCGPTSIFLALRSGEKYAIDPNLERLLALHPFIMDVEEYKDVNFIPKPIEEIASDKKFDLIFMINVLDHIGVVNSVMDKIGELLSPSGTIVVIVDCYADRVVKNILNFFDVDLPHPHHFIVEDIVKLFSSYKLVKQDDRIFHIYDDCTFRGKNTDIEIYRVDQLFRRMRQILRSEGKQGDFFFTIKYVLCYSLALLTAVIRRREKPIHPLKKLRLFVFRNS
jgi:SAM-dependent methyltransferase